jgi:hypothetical protein
VPVWWRFGCRYESYDIKFHRVSLALPEGTSLFKHSLLMDSTKRSAKELRSGSVLALSGTGRWRRERCPGTRG